jgi:hypothetical protein
MKPLILASLIFALAAQLQAQQPPTQYIIAKPGNRLVTPAVSTSPAGGVSITVRPSYANAPDKLEKLRRGFGGTIPFLVVKTEKENFVIMSHERDILVIGHVNPSRIVLRENEGYNVVSFEGCAAIVPNQSQHTLVVEQIDKINVEPEFPSWLKNEILKSRTSYGYEPREVLYYPSHRHLSGGGSKEIINGVTYYRFTLPMRD